MSGKPASTIRITTSFIQLVPSEDERQFYGCIDRCGRSQLQSRDPGSIGATRNGRTFSCKVCSYQSDKWAHMVQHARKHTGERPFACHLCPARFFQRHDLARHVRSHTGEKPFRCRACNERFARRYLRDQHELRQVCVRQNQQ
ncbi:uncharacterized protein LOC144174633 [Haemaphysalis longicornis]